MDRLQTANLTTFLHGRIESTVAIPIPSIGWTEVPTAQLRQAWRAVPLDIEAHPVDEVENSLTGLIKTVALFNHSLPHLTIASLTAIDGWLTHVNQSGVSHRLGLAYPNTEGVADATDMFMSLQEFTKEVQDGAEH
jgi:hypothetical protein